MTPTPPEVAPGNHGYPRPQLRREHWISLNGAWDFAIDPEARWGHPRDVDYRRAILVPFSPETPKSGIGDTGLYRCCWYRRRVAAPPLAPGEELHVHFGAVDYRATIWIDGEYAGEHEGGYTPFSIDVTRWFGSGGEHEICVRAEDDPADLAKPRGKQDWKIEPHSIWYPRTSGIWQTVWMERVAATRLGSLRWTPNLERWEIGLDVRVLGERREGLRLSVRLTCGEQVVASDVYGIAADDVHRRIALADPGIDDFRNELLWSPSRPTIIEAELELLVGDRVIDRVRSYTALRSFSVQGDRTIMNGRPMPLRLVLDQGYWPETGLTSPDDAALRRDVELAKSMGFNGVRKHQKVEDPRYLYWADRLGLLVWGEMPSAYRFTRSSVERSTKQWLEAIERDYSHPCIVAWVPFNESWGVPNLPESVAERHWVQALYHLTKTVDPTRPVIGNDGWESVVTDIIGIHDYELRPERLASRYADVGDRARVLEKERPGGRLIVVPGHPHGEQPLVLSEFGGITLPRAGDAAQVWGYGIAHDAEELASKYSALLATVHALPVFSGFCYTQFADTYQEANGLLYADRKPKFPLEAIYRATRGELSIAIDGVLPAPEAPSEGLLPVGEKPPA